MKKIKITTKSSPTGADSDDGTDEVLFWINKSGFPLSTHVWDRMFDHASKLHPGGDSVINLIKDSKTLPAVSLPEFLVISSFLLCFLE